MAKVVQQTISVRPDFLIKRNKGGTKVESGIGMAKMATVVFDTAKTDSAGVSNKTAAAHGTGVFIPPGAIVTRAFYEVVTAFTSAASTATIALKVTGTGDLVAGIAINDASTPWAAGLHGCLPNAYAEATVAGDTAILDAARQAASWLGPMSAEKEITATVGVQALTAGKLILYVEFVQGI